VCILGRFHLPATTDNLLYTSRDFAGACQKSRRRGKKKITGLLKKLTFTFASPRKGIVEALKLSLDKGVENH
jgi:hypothetical protein